MAIRPLWCNATMGSSSKMIDSGVHDMAWAASGPSPSSGAEVAICSSAGSGSMFNPVLLVGSSPAS